MNTMLAFKDITTLRVGGTISHFEKIHQMDECISFVKELDEKGSEVLILGGGSNILAEDKVFEGTVVVPTFNTIDMEDDRGRVRVTVDAGVVWDDLVQFSVDHDLWGIENLSAIPGNVGAAPMQNIGAYGVDVSETIEWVEVYDRTLKTKKKLSNTELRFGYRNSLLKEERGRYIVLRVSFMLSKNAQPKLSYKDLALRFGGSTTDVPLVAIREAVIDIRSGKFPSLEEYGTAGSFFLNPILSPEEGVLFKSTYPDAPQFQVENGVKVSLAWILDHVVSAKGMRVGGAFVWDKQPLVIATNTNATGNDVRTLMSELQKKVFEATNIHIVPEVYVMQ